MRSREQFWAWVRSDWMMVLFGEGYDFFYEATFFGGILVRPSRIMRFTRKSGTLYSVPASLLGHFEV